MDKLKIIDETIKVTAINRDGKFFEKVSRVEAKSEVMRIDVEFDVNTDIYPMEKDSYYSMVIASSVNTDGSEEFDIVRYEHQQQDGGHGSLLDQYEYAMQGKVFKYSACLPGKTSVFISFGGLLMAITGDQKDLRNLEIDSRVYLLLKKIA